MTTTKTVISFFSSLSPFSLLSLYSIGHASPYNENQTRTRARRSFECLLPSSWYSPSAGCRITCSTFMPITNHTSHQKAMYRICFSDSIGWQCPTAWSIRLFTIGWIADFAIIFRKSCASVVSICGGKMNCTKAKRFTCQIHVRCPLNADRNHVSTQQPIVPDLNHMNSLSFVRSDTLTWFACAPHILSCHSLVNCHVKSHLQFHKI